MKDPIVVASIATRVRFMYGSGDFDYIEAQLVFFRGDGDPRLRLRAVDGALAVQGEASNVVNVKVVDL